MSPERIQPSDSVNPSYDVRADVWSLGITLVSEMKRKILIFRTILLFFLFRSNSVRIVIPTVIFWMNLLWWQILLNKSLHNCPVIWNFPMSFDRLFRNGEKLIFDLNKRNFFFSRTVWSKKKTEDLNMVHYSHMCFSFVHTTNKSMLLSGFQLCKANWVTKTEQNNSQKINENPLVHFIVILLSSIPIRQDFISHSNGTERKTKRDMVVSFSSMNYF